MALDASTHDSLAKLTSSLKERANVGDNLSSVYVLWGFFTLAAMVAAIAVCFTPQADRRFSEALSAPPPAAPAPTAVARVEAPPPAIKAAPEPELEPEPDAELLARLKALEEQLETITGSIAKATAAPPPPPPAPSGVTPVITELPKPAPPAPPPEQVATVEPEAPAEAPAPRAAPPATAFGLDLGSESSFGALRARWDGLRRQHPELARLSPRISVRDNKGRVELRLIAGPFENASDAAKACAALFVKGVSCDGGLFDGQRLPAS